MLQETHEEYLKQHKENLKSVDPKLAVAEQRLEAMFQELVCITLVLLTRNTSSIFSLINISEKQFFSRYSFVRF